MEARDEEALAPTKVFWDMKECPVPAEFDGRLVGPCIKRFLEKLGYRGPLTIAAIGLLTDVPDEDLQAISSTGIVCHAVPFGCDSISSCMYEWAKENPGSNNIMLISDPSNNSLFLDLDMLRKDMGQNIVFPYPYGPPFKKDVSPWKSFLLAESEALDEYECIETGEPASWVCWVCCVGLDDLYGQGFENLTTHLSSDQHAQKLLRWLPREPQKEEEEEEIVDEAENWDWEYFSSYSRRQGAGGGA